MKGSVSIIVVLALALLGGGCSLFKGPPSIKSGGLTVTGPADPGKPATLVTTNAGESVALPSGSTVTVTHEGPLPAIPATKDAPAQPARPETTKTEIKPAGASEWRKTEATVKADTGTVETSVKQHEIDAEESRPLLYAAIVSCALAGLFLYLKYPTPALGCGVAAVVFFVAWKVSGLPSWFWGVGLLAAGGATALYFGHERGIKTAQETNLPPKP